MPWKRFAVLVLALGCVCVEGQTDVADRLRRADELTQLDNASLKPWYMKVAFQLYDKNGKPGETGTMEEWWAGTGLSKRVVQSASYTTTYIVNQDAVYQTRGTKQLPYALEVLERQMIHPMPRAGEVDGLAPKLMSDATKDPRVECIMYTKQFAQILTNPLGILPTYCFEPGKDMLQVSYDYAALAVVRICMGMFQKRVMPIDLNITINRKDVVSSHLVALRTLAPGEIGFATPGAGEEPYTVPFIRREATEVLWTAVYRPPIHTPKGVVPYQQTWPVEIRVRVGTDGHIHAIRLLNAPDARMATATMAGVIDWRFGTQHEKGKPTEVESDFDLILNGAP